MRSRNKDRISQGQIRLFDKYLSVVKEVYQTLNREQRKFVLGEIGTLAEKLLEDEIFTKPPVSSLRYQTTRKNLAYDRERAKEIRKQAGLSQKKLCEELGLIQSDRPAITKYESGMLKPSNPPRGKVSKAYTKWLKGKGYNPFNL